MDRMTDIHPRQLAGLVAIADHGHLGRAAVELQTTPRALSRTLRELERGTGETLLAGGERQARLTASGLRIAESSRAPTRARCGWRTSPTRARSRHCSTT
jgi:DNA-binding transcriptional LysR family regulator